MALHIELEAELDRHQVVNGLAAAEELIGYAIRLIIPYAEDCGGCLNQLFGILANRQLQATHDTGRMNGLTLGMGDAALSRDERFSAHLSDMQPVVEALLIEALEESNPF